MDEQNYLGNI